MLGKWILLDFSQILVEILYKTTNTKQHTFKIQYYSLSELGKKWKVADSTAVVENLGRGVGHLAPAPAPALCRTRLSRLLHPPKPWFLPALHNCCKDYMKKCMVSI